MKSVIFVLMLACALAGSKDLFVGDVHGSQSDWLPTPNSGERYGSAEGRIRLSLKNFREVFF